MLLGGATLAVLLGAVALFGVRIMAIGLQLTPEDFPTDWRAALILLGALGVATWTVVSLSVVWYAVRSARLAVPKVSAPRWYTGTPSIPHFTPSIPPPEAAYTELHRHVFQLSDAHPQSAMPAHLERTQVPTMPPLLSYESLFPTEQTAQIPPLPSQEDASDTEPTIPPQDA